MEASPASDLANLVRRLRLSAGLSQEELAERSGLSARAISDIERGLRSTPRPETLRMLADALELSGSDRQGLFAAARPSIGVRPVRSAPALEQRNVERVLTLPASPGRLIGRDGALAEIVSMIEAGRSRLITLTGPGGVGKTRLAIEAAHQVRHQFTDGVAFIDLAPIADHELVAQTIGNALDIRESLERPMRESLFAVLEQSRALLLIDNFEQVIDAAPLIRELASHCPGLQVIVTSREALRVRGETEVAVSPLELPVDNGQLEPGELGHIPAIALFIEAVRGGKPDFSLDASNVDDVTEICRRLDGLPLALELAASRIRYFTPRELLGHLDRSLPLLVDGPRDLPSRQRTLRNTVAWSYDLLSPDEQAIFRRLGVFVGGARLEAIESVVPAVAPLELDLLAGLASLVDRNLVRDTTDFDGSSRFAMLETIREFALEVLAASGELPATQLALARWNLVLIDVENLQLSPGLQALAQRRLASDFDNLRASLRWAIDQEDSALANRLSGGLGVFWYSHGDLVEGRRWLEATLAMTGPIPAEVQALALLSAGRLAHYQGNASRAEELLRKSLSLYKRLGDCDGRGKALMLLGITEEDAGEYLAAKHLLDEARHCFDEIGDRGQAALVIYHLGVTAYGIGELDQAMACYAEALRISREVGDSFVIAATQEFITLACCARGDFRQAAEACEEALAIDWDRGSLEGADQEGIAINFANLSVLAVAIELDAIAVRIRAAAESIRDRIGLSSIRLPGRLDYEHAMETALQRLGEREFATCWSTGLTEPWDNRQQDIDTALSHARIIGSRR